MIVALAVMGVLSFAALPFAVTLIYPGPRRRRPPRPIAPDRIGGLHGGWR